MGAEAGILREETQRQISPVLRHEYWWGDLSSSRQGSRSGIGLPEGQEPGSLGVQLTLTWYPRHTGGGGTAHSQVGMPGSEQVTPTKHAATGCEAGYRARERGARGKEGRRAGGTLVPRSCCQRCLNGSFHPRDPEGRRDVPLPLQMRKPRFREVERVIQSHLVSTQI